ncbi:MAG: DUF2283 domain-containing protein [bacterium]
MKIKYFKDTDTILMIFKEAEIADTRDLDENTLVEFDAEGNLVSITIEHATERANINDFSYEQLAVT